jgi:hypothetical protein
VLIVAELGARFFYSDVTPDVVTDEVLNHVWIPFQVRVIDRYEKMGIPEYSRTVNAQGFPMARDVSRQKGDGIYRIAYLGDSFTEGTCSEVDSVPAIVERSLRAQGFKSVEVINAGTPSYAPTLYYLLLKTISS